MQALNFECPPSSPLSDTAVTPSHAASTFHRLVESAHLIQPTLLLPQRPHPFNATTDKPISTTLPFSSFPTTLPCPPPPFFPLASMSSRPSSALHHPSRRPHTSAAARQVGDTLIQSMTRAREKPSTSHNKTRPPLPSHPPPALPHPTHTPSPLSTPHYSPLSFTSSPGISPPSTRRPSWNLHDLNSTLPSWPPPSPPEEEGEDAPSYHSTPYSPYSSLPSYTPSPASTRPHSRLSSRTPSLPSSRPSPSGADFPPPSLFTLTTLPTHCSHYHSYPSLLQLQREKEQHGVTSPSLTSPSEGSDDEGEEGSRPEVPIVIGNFFEGSGTWAGEEEKVGMTVGGRGGRGGGMEGGWSEEGRSRPVSSRGSRR